MWGTEGPGPDSVWFGECFLAGGGGTQPQPQPAPLCPEVAWVQKSRCFSSVASVGMVWFASPVTLCGVTQCLIEKESWRDCLPVTIPH